MNALKEKAKAAAEAVAAKASAASEVAIEKARKEAESAKTYVAAKREEIRPKLKAAMDSAEPSLKEFMAHPQMQYLKKNPKAIAAICAILCAVGIPGAASVSALVSLIGPVEMLFPMVMMMVNPVAEVIT